MWKKNWCIFLSCWVIAMPIFGESLAEQDNQARRNPKNNWAAKVAGAATAVGVAAVAVGKADEANKKPTRGMTAEEKALFERFKKDKGSTNLYYGYGNNFETGTRKIETPLLGIRMYLEGDYAFRYENKMRNYTDGSATALNTFAFEWYTMPLLNVQTQTAMQIGAYIGARGIKVSTGGDGTTDPIFGLLLNHYLLDQAISLHLSGNAAIVRMSDFTVDYTIDASAQYHLGALVFEAGVSLDITDIERLRAIGFGLVRLHF